MIFDNLRRIGGIKLMLEEVLRKSVSNEHSLRGIAKRQKRTAREQEEAHRDMMHYVADTAHGTDERIKALARRMDAHMRRIDDGLQTVIALQEEICAVDECGDGRDGCDSRLEKSGDAHGDAFAEACARATMPENHAQTGYEPIRRIDVLSRLDSLEDEYKRITQMLLDMNTKIADVIVRLDSLGEKLRPLDTSATTDFNAFDNRKYDRDDDRITPGRIISEWLNGDGSQEESK